MPTSPQADSLVAKEFALDGKMLPALNTLKHVKSELATHQNQVDIFNKQRQQIIAIIEEIGLINVDTATHCQALLSNQLTELDSKASIIDCRSIDEIHALEVKLQAHYQEIMLSETLTQLRRDLMGAMQLCALTYSNKEFSLTTSQPFINDFNLQFAGIATAKLTDTLPELSRDETFCDKLSFSELEQAANKLLKNFYDRGSSLPWNYGNSSQKTIFIGLVNDEIADFCEFKDNTFSWRWNKLQLSYNKNLRLNTQVDQLNTAISIKCQSFTESQADLTLLLNQAKQEKISAEHDYALLISELSNLSTTATAAMQHTRDMVIEYLTMHDAMSQHNVMPYATMANLITRAEQLATDINIQQLLVANSISLQIVLTAKIEVVNLNTNLTTVLNEFNAIITKIQPLRHSINDIASDPALLSLRKAMTAQDQLIAVTQKFASLLGNVKYFNSKVSWGGGTSVTQNGVTYSVPTSYAELFQLKNAMLIQPLSHDNAVAFWMKAKEIAGRAQQRGSYRYFFFKVRSNETNALLDLINGINIHSMTLLTDSDVKLNKIKSNWQQDQMQYTIPLKPEVDLAAAVSGHLRLNGSC
jgi:hypothetical protein